MSNVPAVDGTSAADDGKVSQREVLAIAVPIILSNATEPLIGIVDTAVLGQLGKPHLVGAAALGATVFAMAFWLFGFLRMGTSGLAAQADGAGDQDTVSSTFLQALIVAGLAGVGLIILQIPISSVALWLLQGTPAVENATQTYITIRIWSAPFALANFAMLGWLIGIRRTKLAFLLQILINGLNIILNYTFVIGFGMEIEGVAYGTVLAEAIAATVGLWLVWKEMLRRGPLPAWAVVFDRDALLRVFAVNRDIMIRTVVLILSLAFFVNEGARAGEIVLAANAILYHILSLTAHVLDGFAYAAETLSGHAVGAKRKNRFLRAVRLSSLWSGVLAAGLGIFFWLIGGWFIDLLTVHSEVRETARIYLFWAVLTPVTGFACFQLDGIFVGATRTAEMRNSVILSALIYLAAWAVLHPLLANHGLWMALHVLFIARAVTLGAYYPRLVRSLFQ